LSIRNKLKEREEARDKANGPGINEGLPEGVTRYVFLSKELAQGKTFAFLADPDNWFFYYVHEDGDYATRATYFRKHTCLHSPRKLGENFDSYTKPNGTECLSCKAKAKRKLYFMIPVYDFEYATWRVLDMKEYHASNIIGDYDKLEKAAKKFDKTYTLVGDAISINKTSDGKSYSMESYAVDVEGLSEADAAASESKFALEIEEAKKFMANPIPYDELVYFREEDDIRKILDEADATKVDKSVLGTVAPPAPKETATGDSTPITDEDAPPEDLGF